LVNADVALQSRHVCIVLIKNKNKKPHIN